MTLPRAPRRPRLRRLMLLAGLAPALAAAQVAQFYLDDVTASLPPGVTRDAVRHGYVAPAEELYRYGVEICIALKRGVTPAELYSDSLDRMFGRELGRAMVASATVVICPEAAPLAGDPDSRRGRATTSEPSRRQ